VIVLTAPSCEVALKADWPCLDPLVWDSDGDMLPDGWEQQYGLSPCECATTNSPAWDADGDGLGLFDEYRYCTDPTNPDTDGDGVRDGDEVPHSPGSCPNDPDDEGNPANCVTLKLTVGDPSGSHSERWNFEVFEETTGRTVVRHCDDGFGTPGSAEYALVKGKAYTFSLRWIGTNLDEGPDYDWQALINDSDVAGAREGLYGTGAFIVEDSYGLLTEETHGDEFDITIGETGRIIVPRIKLEPITCGTVGAGVIVNPSGVAAGGLAVYRVEVEPEDAVADEDIHWSVAHGGVTFYSNHNTGREAIIRGGAVESDFKLEVRIGDVPETGCPYIHGRVLQPTVTPIHVYIICSNGVPAVSVDTVNAWVTEANRIYTQAAMSFYMAGVEYVASNDWFSINSSAEFHQMCSYASGTGGLELYCVDYMSSPGRHVGAPFCGMAVRGDANLNTLAHEIGHACGLGDIVDSPAGTAVSEALSGALNWSGGEGAGYYDPTLMHDALVRRLLMFYTANPQKADISRADVKGRVPDPYVPYEIFIRTGLLNMNRNPRH
jgi:hypothetical protein